MTAYFNRSFWLGVAWTTVVSVAVTLVLRRWELRNRFGVR
jgi:hypothetical protein